MVAIGSQGQTEENLVLDQFVGAANGILLDIGI